MPDWKTLVRERLNRLDLTSQAVLEEVIAEIAAHLDDLYEAQLAAGSDESQALEHALRHVTNWRPLAKKIKRAKRNEGIMNDRSKQFWLPALLSLTASMIWLMLLQLSASRIQSSWRYEGVTVWPYFLWIVTLPLVGAAAGYLSYRGGSRRPTRFTAVIFPSIVMSVLWAAIVGFLLIRKTPQAIHALSIGYGFLFWVVVPGVALLAGALPWSKSDPVQA